MAQAGQEDGALRQLEPHWNKGMIVASLAISLLGAFTSTQLMCQARASIGFHTVLVWTLLASLTFGFCSIWCLHFVAMLAYELDLQISIDASLTILSAILAVAFTFAALAFDLLYNAYEQHKNKKISRGRKRTNARNTGGYNSNHSNVNYRPLLNHAEDSDNPSPDMQDPESGNFDFEHNGTNVNNAGNITNQAPLSPRIVARNRQGETKFVLQTTKALPISDFPPEQAISESADGTRAHTESRDHSVSTRSSSLPGSMTESTFGLSAIMNHGFRRTTPAKNIFKATAETLYSGCNLKNLTKGFLWSLAITSMHYSGLAALQIPEGHLKLNYALVVLSGLISWCVCVVGCILMSHMETHLKQQLLFSITATVGVAAMHFTGMQAAAFYSRSPPTEARGYPPALATAIVSIAIVTCFTANGLLAHSVTVTRNKLAELVLTRENLWRMIVQKENAEAAAAARSDFIASASHEIRTPLHHLQGYSDLLSQTELTEEGRSLLHAIQRATKTLSLITNNVLDWSKLERDSENICRPVALDIRTVCEAVLILLPNKEDEPEVEVMVVVSPDVPKSIFLDETYIHRILMNLLSNAMKFTSAGYILVLIEIKDGILVATVKDTGPGIPPSFLPQLFEPFKQAQTRGTHRGTGLGLSIVRKLVDNMNGSISVDSQHPEAKDYEFGLTGSTFTVRIPVQAIGTKNQSSDSGLPKIAILHDEANQSVDGLRLAWEKFGFEVTTALDFEDLPASEWKYIWGDVSFLKENSHCLKALLNQDKCPVLVPYDNVQNLYQIPQLSAASHFIPLPKPLIWHSFSQRIAAAGQKMSTLESKLVRFASNVDIVNGNGESQTSKQTEKNLLVLLVEDNPINQKLGKKMLATLGYKVQTAENGQEAVEFLKENDLQIDAILMDQSMPVKDGVTATREIREMEASGTLSRQHRIIALTAVVSSQAQESFKSAGADDFLAKPLSLAKLEHALSVHLPVKRPCAISYSH